MGDDSLEITEEMMDQSSNLRSQALSAVSDGNNEMGIDLFNKAIKLNPQSAILFAKRAR